MKKKSNTKEVSKDYQSILKPDLNTWEYLFLQDNIPGTNYSQYIHQHHDTAYSKHNNYNNVSKNNELYPVNI